MVAVAFDNGLVGPAAPSWMVGPTAPNPVTNTDTVSPICAGFLALTSVPSWWTTSPYPRPFCNCVSTPGAVVLISDVTALEGTLLFNTCTLATVPVTP